MTDPMEALDRSLREGPPDEEGYRPISFATRPGTLDEVTSRSVPLGRGASVRTVRRPPAGSSWQALAAVILLAIIGLASFVLVVERPAVGPGTSGSPSATPITLPPLTETFVSTRHGFSVRYPTGWTVTPATASWAPDTVPPLGNPALDELKRPGQARLVVASQPLPAGQTQEEWLAAFFHPFQGATPCAGDPSGWPRLPIDGESGYLDAAGCVQPADRRISDRDVWYEAIVFSGGRVYQIRLDGDIDMAAFEAVLETIRLDPSRAVD